MAKQTGRSLQLSVQGIQNANTALQKFTGKRDLAANLGMSPTTVTNFFAGRPVKRKEFHEICKKLRLDWQEVADLPRITESESSKPSHKLQDNSSDIDELVQEVRSRCRDKVQNLYSKIRLLNRQQIDVDKLYVDVYVLEKLGSESYATIPELLKGSDLRDGFERLGLGKREKRSPGFDVAAKYSRLMVLGKPGSGKTTFLRHLAVACCKGEFLADHIPILIELRDINASEFNLLNHIHQELDLADEEQTKQILKQGKVLILLDGLDEVPSQSRQEVQDHIYKFSQSTQYYKNRFILTCRTQTTEYTLSTFDYVEVAEFKPEQVEIFAKNWFTALAETPEQGAKLAAQFLEKLTLPENKQTAELAVTPILLSLTCWVFNALKDLPPKRSDLYERGINLLLEKWDEKRGVRREVGSEAYRNLSVGEKKKLLSYLAARKFEQEQYVLFEQGELQGYIAEYLGISIEDSEAVLDAVAAEHGLLIERAQGFWSFSHLTFQEYFTAKWFCDRVDDHDWQRLVAHITDKHWQEVFLLAVERIANADELIQLMNQRIDKLAAENVAIQNFLIRIEEKSILVNLSYKRAAVRAFYFIVCLDNRQGFDLAGTLDQTININQTFDLLFDSHLIGVLETSVRLDLDLTLEQLFKFDRIPDLDLLEPRFAFTYLHSLDSDIICAFALSTAETLNRAITYALHQDLNLQLKQLLQKLQQLQDQLLELTHDKEKFKQWLQSNGKAWIGNLRNAIIQYRHIGYDWQLKPQKKKVLQEYYYANLLLVKCLNRGCHVSPQVQEKIEESLLLPIAETKED